MKSYKLESYWFRRSTIDLCNFTRVLVRVKDKIHVTQFGNMCVSVKKILFVYVFIFYNEETNRKKQQNKEQ